MCDLSLLGKIMKNDLLGIRHVVHPQYIFENSIQDQPLNKVHIC